MLDGQSSASSCIETAHPVEPIFALVLAWDVLGQRIAAVQLAGGLRVVATVMWLCPRRC